MHKGFRWAKCLKGLHEMTTENTWERTNPNGTKSRYCRACRRQSRHLNYMLRVVAEKELKALQESRGEASDPLKGESNDRAEEITPAL